MELIQRFIYLSIFTLVGSNMLGGCSSAPEQVTEKEAVLNVYTHRHYPVDKEIFAEFTKKTNIQVNVLFADASQIVKRLEVSGEESPADVVLTVDAHGMYEAKKKQLLQSIESETLNKNIPETFRDKEGYWYGLTYRGRIIVYNEERVQRQQLSTYQALTTPEWEDKVLIRSSKNVYNQALMASFVALYGREKAAEWARGIVDNMARTPKGNDREQIKSLAQGIADVAIVNTYYIGLLAESKDSLERASVKNLGVFFPNQDEEGAHINMSMAGVTKYAPHKENAIKFIEFLSTKSIQEKFAQANFEYPVNPESEWHPLLKSWGKFKTQKLSIDDLAELNEVALQIFQEVNWK